MAETQKYKRSYTRLSSYAMFALGRKFARLSNRKTEPSSSLARRSLSASLSRLGSLCARTLMLAFAVTLGTALSFTPLSLVSTTLAMNDDVRSNARVGQMQDAQASMGASLKKNRQGMAVAPANTQTSYVGESSLTQALRGNQSRPLTLASADFDGDGMPDLVAGYATRNGGGIVTIQRGNVHALFPYGDAVREGEPPAFLPTAQVFALPEAPDFLGAGDFDADGHWDVVAAKRGSSALFFMQGDQRGGLRAAQRTEVSGRVTALTTGEINRRDGLTDIVVGTDGPDGAKALVFESPEGAMKGTPEVFNLRAAATSFALGQFVGDYMTDLAIAAGDNLLIVGGRDRRLTLNERVEPAVTSSRQLPFSITAIVAGKFTGDFEGDLALSSNDGRVYLLTPPMAAASGEAVTGPVATVATGVDTAEGAYTPVPTMVSAVAKGAPGSSSTADDSPQFIPLTDGPIGDWQLNELAGSALVESSLARRGSLLVRTRVSGAANDELLVLDGENHRLRIVGTETDKRERRDRGPHASSPREVEDAITASLKAEDEPVAVLPMRLNRDALSDLVILKRNSTAPAIAVSVAGMTFTVNTTADVNNDFRCDATYCSLRGAISAANANPGPDLIAFNIPGTGVRTINTVVGFSNITDPVTIDGYTQPGSSPNTLVNGDNAVVLIELNGAAAQQGSIGLSIFNGANNVFRGLAIGGYRFQQGTEVQAGGFGIAFHGSSGGSDNNFVEGCFVGTNAAGTVANPNNNGGIFVFQFSDNNTFGGTTPAARNLLSGNGRDGRAELNVSASAGCSVCTTGNKAQGNFVGTEITGTRSLDDDSAGIFFFAAHNSLIGGTAPGARNILSGKNTGISFQANGNPTHQMPGALVQGNFLGLNVNGDILSNSTGMSFGAVFDTTFGGTTPAAANTSSGNTTGLFFANNATNNLIQGNFIGTDANGANKGNTFHGIFLSAARQNVIGGVVPGARNVIAFTVGNGIRTNTDTNSNRNTIRGNSIHSNTMLGIDLAGNGVTPNDAAACDADTGPNELQNFPVLTDVPSGTVFVTATATNSTGNTSEFSQCVRAQLSGGDVSIQGTLDSRASSTFTLDFYVNSACDSSGNGEGQTYLGSTTVTSSAACSAAVNVSLPAPAPATFQFSQSNFAVSESAGFVNINVVRSGETGTAVAVDYLTTDNSDVIPDESQAVAMCAGVNSVALSKCDFNTALGTLRFAAGETTKSFTVLLTQDSYVEGSEFALLSLTNPTNGAALGNQSSATLQITDDQTEPATNAIDDARNFVRQHYHDFLNREPDQAGWDFWTDNITKCNDPARRPAGQTVEQCIDKQRETTSGAFFLSPEFQYTGQYVYVVYQGSLGRRPTYLEFMRDAQQLSRGIIDANGVSAATIESNRADYVGGFVLRAQFVNIYGALSNQGYVDKLFQTTGTNVSNADRQALVDGLGGGTETRATVLHKVVNGTRVISEGQVEIIAVYGKAFYDTQFNPAFVQMEYFGYMRRNEDTAGFNFWLGKLNFYGDFITAEMVRSFLLSPEYRRRFGSQ